MPSPLRNYMDEIRQVQRYWLAPKSLRRIFNQARHSGLDALFTESGHLTVWDGHTGAQKIYDREARLLFLKMAKAWSLKG